MIVILIGTIALGMAAPMITKQLKNETLTNTQMQILQKQIDNLRRNQGGVPEGAIMFFDLSRCPDWWDFVGDEYIGHYPRIVGEGTTNGTGDTVEQMVHRHKHVSPLIVAPTSSRISANIFRYGPNKAVYTIFSPSGDTDGEYLYPEFSFSRDGALYKVHLSGQGITGGGLAGADGNNWYTYTSDGMNRVEIIGGASDSAYSILICPNKDENDAVCKRTGNRLQYTDSANKTIVMNFNNTHYDYMPLVGNENRPNSVKWLACRKTND